MFSKYNKQIILILIALQFLWIAGTVIILEVNLAFGKTVKLQIVPVDPRSLMQRDYVVLNYSISRIKGYYPEPWEQTVRVVIRPDQNGVYQVKSIYHKDVILDKDDIVINGKPRGSRVLYGIETYFVPEGTGRKVERAARYGLVKVSALGDAMLVELIEK
jgi:uncharacterized membrane-anchored protein